MKRLLVVLLLITLVASLTACSGQQKDTIETTPQQQQEVSNTPVPSETAVPTPAPTPTPEPKIYSPIDLLGTEFNPYAKIELPDNFIVLSAVFTKGSPKLEGKNPFKLSISAQGNMYAAVAYLADVSGLSEQEKKDRFNEYSENGFCEFTGTDGYIVSIWQEKPHDEKHENGACLIELTYNVPDADLEKYTGLIRDNYNMNALASVKDLFNIEPDYTECGIELDLQRNEANVSVQYYVDDADSIQQSVAEISKDGLGEWYGHPSAVIPYGMINNTLVFDSRFGAAVLVIQSSKELNSSLGQYIEPEFSLVKFGFGFDDAGVCGVYSQKKPYDIEVAIRRPEWGDSNEDWNISYTDQYNGYGLGITYYIEEDRYHIHLVKDNENAGFDYFPAKNEYTGQYPDQDKVNRMFNEAFGTEGEGFYDKPMACFEQLVQERFGMSIDELYALPKQ